MVTVSNMGDEDQKDFEAFKLDNARKMHEVFYTTQTVTDEMRDNVTKHYVEVESITRVSGGYEVERESGAVEFYADDRVLKGYKELPDEDE